ncbi:sigma-54 interaction domain-containing protein [Lutispora thermophila]|uniref:Transcriptional regulator containing PAS, AAA-type ATPase, and DNA-binding Fis domains n=1 Tax=Lutispora thermophila DSM 19022 TaxID=1122184 RepID=A0A1M6H861_9FIRM|nr:sigma 54-interacting transcriptional regulator [Lutispora thermophila]SHJ18365.1 Transcriptional regulator containing PAS, AAA-type ATPase, and DNA-binding Fis domains [Lutispora thermophila DSM 19022]
MKKLIIISPGKVTSINLAVQLEKIFRQYIEIQPYCLEDDFDFDMTNALVVLSSPQAIDARIQSLMNDGLNYIIARRVINHRYIAELLSLPKATEVLLVNDRAESTFQAITQLQALGVNYIKYYPYYPGIAAYPELDIAVTVGEPHLVPYGIKKVIDIGTRQIDITTVADIAKRLGLMDALGSRLSSQYIHEIIGLLNRINDSAKEMKVISDRLRTVANCLTKAIVYIDKDGNIITGNQELYNLLECSHEDIIGKNLKDVLPEISGSDINSEKVDVLLIRGKQLLVTSRVVKGTGSEDGIIYTFEKSEDIEKNEHELRRRTTNVARSKYYTFDDIIYKCSNMDKLIEKVKAFAHTDSTILIQGESGTGKELLAQAIHCASKRANGPFVPVNFAAMPMSLLESELFGYEEGSFTGAKKGGKRGLFEEAHGGTIFLDEIGDASLEFQCRLLRVIQERQVRRVGGLKEIPIDVRFIAATNRNLTEEIKKGNFRADLYYRLNVLPVRTLSLRERKEDIPVLADYFLTRYSDGSFNKIKDVLHEDAIEALLDYDWPGNTRQLENAMEYIASLGSKNRKLERSELPEYLINDFDKTETSILKDLLGESMVWILEKIKNSEGLGRRYIAELAKKEGVQLTEGQIRSLLNSAEQLGFVKVNTGRKGTVLTDKGIKILTSISNNGKMGGKIGN